MPMKIKGLYHFCHDIYEKKGTWLELQVVNGDGTCAQGWAGSAPPARAGQASPYKTCLVAAPPSCAPVPQQLILSHLQSGRDPDGLGQASHATGARQSPDSPSLLCRAPRVRVSIAFGRGLVLTFPLRYGHSRVTSRFRTERVVMGGETTTKLKGRIFYVWPF
jgi:hypothetical protein